MTLRGRVVTLFPVLFVGASAAAVIQFARAPSLPGLLGLLALWYLVPPLCFRVHDLCCPLREGREDLADPRKYSAWWASQQFQIAYTMIPQLEMALRLVPGLYSAWLRLWGSRIGSGVMWTPVVEIMDRSLLDIGDQVFVGHQVAMVAHTVVPKGARHVLHVARIRVGNGAFISGRSGLGLGARVAPGEFLSFGTHAYLNRRFG
jgi:hypothetical protein